MNKAGMITTVHDRYDTRVFLKQAEYLSALYPDSFALYVADGKGDEHKNGITIRDLGKRPRNKFARIFWSSYILLKTIRKEGLDCVHVHDPELTVPAFLVRMQKTKFIYDVHEDYSGSILHKHWIPRFLRRPIAGTFSVFEKFNARFIDHIVAATPTIAKIFPEDKTVLVQNFPRTGDLMKAEQTGAPSSANRFSYVGSISEVRAMREPLEALVTVNRTHSATISICGSFNPPALEQEIRQGAGWEHAEFHGWVGKEKTLHEMAGSIAGLVLFYPTPNNIESQPNKMFEYMLSGLPVIASHFPKWVEIIDRYKCGLCVDPESPEEIAEAMTRIIENPDEARQMGENGRKAVLEHLNWEQEFVALEALYRSL